MSVRRLSPAVALALLTALLWCAPPAQAAPPGNDNRANATFTQWGNTVGVTTTEATNEVGEAQPCGVSSGHSVWYRLNANSSSTYIFDTVGSAFDTVVSVENEAGTTLGCNDDVTPGTPGSRVAVALTAGQTYFIRVAGFSGNSGNFLMSVQAEAPANDDRANAALLSFTPNQSIALLQSDAEGDEPTAGCDAGVQGTVWYKFTATQTGRLAIDNRDWYGSRIRLYDNTTGTPQIVVCDTYRDGDSGQYSSIVQYVVPGHQYLVQVGAANASSQSGRMSVSFAAATPPSYDAFATPTTLTGTTGSTLVEGGQLTTEFFEYPLYGTTIGQHSAWFRWTAPSNGVLTLGTDVYPSWIKAWVDVASPALLSEDGLGTPTLVANKPGLTLPVLKGKTYRILADTRFAQPFTLTRSFKADPVPLTKPARVALPSAGVKKKTATIKWPTPANGGTAITRYTVTIKYRSKSGAKRTIIKRVTAPTHKLVLKRLKAGRYTVTVTATNKIGTSIPSKARVFRVR